MTQFNTKAVKIAEQLSDAGYKTYFVGGAVRDLIRGVACNDVDIATEANPEQITRLLSSQYKIDTVGKSYLVTMVDNIEVATLRVDRYLNAENPSEVSVVQACTIEEDLARRDFTINAMAIDVATGELIDPFGGVKDLELYPIKFVGNSADRIKEDPVRILRAIRFEVVLGGVIESNSLDAIFEYAKLVMDKVPMERINLEICKVLKHWNSGKFFDALLRIGLLQYILPSLARTQGVSGGEHHGESVYKHCLMAGNNISPRFPLLRMAAYLHDIGKPYSKIMTEDGHLGFYGHETVGADLARQDLQRLCFPKEDIDKIVSMIGLHMRPFIWEDTTGAAIRRLGRDLADNGWTLKDWLRIKHADKSANLKSSNYSIGTLKTALRKIREAYTVCSQGFSLRDLAINGNDVMQITGLKPGKIIGKILQTIFDAVIAEPELNNRDALTKALQVVYDGKGKVKIV